MSASGRSRLRLTEMILLGGIFLDLVGFGMVLPDVQFRSERLGMPGWEIGLALTVTFVIQLFASPWWGRASDRLGRKPILLACSSLSALGLMTYGMAHSPALIIVSRALSGFGGANVSIAQAVIADSAESEARTASLGRLGAAVSAGLIAGAASLAVPILRGANIGLVAGCLSLSGVVMLIMLPVRRSEATSTPAPSPPSRLGFGLLSELPKLRPLIITAVVAWFSLAMLEGTFGRLIERTLGFTRREFGEIFAVEAVVGVVSQGALLAWLANRTQPLLRLRASYVCQGIGLLLMPLAVGLGPLFGAGAMYSAGSGIANGTVNALCSLETPADRQGELFGVLQGARSVGFAVGPVLGGILFDVRPNLPYILAALTCIGAAILVRVPSHDDD